MQHDRIEMRLRSVTMYKKLIKTTDVCKADGSGLADRCLSWEVLQK